MRRRRLHPADGPHDLEYVGSWEGFETTQPSPSQIRLIQVERMTLTARCTRCGLNETVDIEVVNADTIHAVLQEAGKQCAAVVCSVPCRPPRAVWYVRWAKAVVRRFRRVD